MEHHFTLPVTYQDQELSLPGRLVTFGYQLKWYVIVDGHELIFERDDEMNYRVVAYCNEQAKTIPKDLLAAIVATLQQLDD